MLKETNNNFKNILTYSIDQIQDLVKVFKEQYFGHLKTFLMVIQGLTSYEETFILQMSTLAKDHINVIKKIDEAEILSKFRKEISGSEDMDEEKSDEEMLMEPDEKDEGYFDLN